MTCGGARALAILVSVCVLSALRADDRADAVNDLLAPLRVKDGPGCVVGVVQRGKLLYSAAFGLANLEARRPITIDTQFDVASMSKQFTAASLYFLVESGKLALEDPVRRFVPELPEYAGGITLSDLLHHTSGLRDLNPLLEIAGRLRQPLDGAASLQLLRSQSALNFPPGTDYEYTNTDYFLLGLIVERTSGQSLAAFAEEHLFRPLGMTHTSFQGGVAAAGIHALGYSLQGEKFRETGPAPLTNGDGGVRTTLEDLRLWDQNLYTGKVGGSRFIAFMETSGRLRSGEPVGYAAGLSVGRYRGARVVSHDGLLPGYRADFTQFPGFQLSSIFLCNRGDADAPALNRRIAAIYLTGHLRPRRGAADVDYPTTPFPELDGVWESRQGWILRAWSGIDGMTIDSAEERYKLYPLNRRQLFTDDGGFRLTLTMLSTDRMSLQWDGALPVAYQRLEPVSMHADQLAALAGEYRCPDAGADWNLVFRQGSLVITTAAGWRIPLDAIGSDRFVVGPWSLHFIRDSQGRPQGIQLHRARLWNLWFARVP